jgi:Domain of unknown function (DUF1902)
VKPNRISVRAMWDDEANVWIAESDGIGLVTEAATMETLRQKVPQMIRDLLEAENRDGPFEVSFQHIPEGMRVTSPTK